MQIELWVRHEFEAAHNLAGTFPPGHQCCRDHGHRYEVTVAIACEDTGQDVMVDYHEMHACVAEELGRLDHQHLNEIMDVPTTCENVCRWLWRRLEVRWPDLARVEVKEQSNTGCVLRQRRDR